MNITTSARVPARPGDSALLITLDVDGTLSTAGQRLDESCQGRISRAIKRGDVKGDKEHATTLHDLPGMAAERVILVGMGAAGPLAPGQYLNLCESVANRINASSARNLYVYLPGQVSVEDQDTAWQCAQLALAVHRARYRFTEHKSAPTPPGKHPEQVVLVLEDKSERTRASKALIKANAIAGGETLARDLGNLAGNVCTPEYLAGRARKLGKQHTALSVKVLDEKRMASLGMGALLGVAQGSRQPPRLICMEYKGAAASGAASRQAPVVLVGKGITFDTGGISIKPSAGMEDMKFDMCGAASVFGVMQAVAELGLKRNVIGVVAAAENMPDGAAIRPGDVLTTLSGQTVEVLNTDAEGRLVLCDALTYVKRYKPAAIIDIATLTGAAVVALGHVTSALLANDDDLCDQLRRAGEQSGDLTWPLPLFDEYQSLLDSPFADMANIGGRSAGTITAACFLSRFVEDTPWAHLDIAGVAWSSGKNRSATGRPVPLLMQYLLQSGSA